MGLLIEIAALSLVGFGLVILALQYLALWLGTRFGEWHRRRRAAGSEETTEGVGIVVGGLLGLLAFTLGLMISIAETRFEERRRVALDEANAIGTAWLRAHTVGGPRGTEIARLLEDYTRTRLAWLRASHEGASLDQVTAASGQSQAVIWGHATAIARERPDAIAGGLLASLNQTFDLATTQRWAFSGQIPAQLPWLLLGLTVAGVVGIGYQWGLRGSWHPYVAMLLLGGWSACLVLVADLANPRIGWVRVDPAPYLWTIEGFAGGVVIPPAPP